MFPVAPLAQTQQVTSTCPDDMVCSWVKGTPMSTHLVTAGDPIAQLIHEVLTIVMGQRVGHLHAQLQHGLLENLVGRQWWVLVVMLVIDPVLVFPSHLREQFRLHYGFPSEDRLYTGCPSSCKFTCGNHHVSPAQGR